MKFIKNLSVIAIGELIYNILTQTVLLGEQQEAFWAKNPNDDYNPYTEELHRWEGVHLCPVLEYPYIQLDVRDTSAGKKEDEIIGWLTAGNQVSYHSDYIFGKQKQRFFFVLNLESKEIKIFANRELRMIDNGSKNRKSSYAPKAPTANVEQSSAAQFSIISVSFSSEGKTYDYLLENRSKQKVFKDQKVKIVTGGNSSQTVYFKHLKKSETIPSRVTKKILLMTPETAIVGIVDKSR